MFSALMSVAPSDPHAVHAETAPEPAVPPVAKTYTPEFDSLNIKEQMTLSPMFTPDNAIDIHAAWLAKANTSIDVQNQYITMFGSGTWAEDESPIVRGLVEANSRGVTVRVQVREDADSDDVTSYLLQEGIEVRWMGNSTSGSDGSYLSETHNKLIIIDGQVVLLSSINFGENAFTNNREAGMVIKNSNAAAYYTSIFEADWNDGEIPPSYPNHPLMPRTLNEQPSVYSTEADYPSHTDIPRQNFTGEYNVTLFANPDNADEVIFEYLSQAQESIYVSMYTISRTDFVDTLVNLKIANPSIDIQVLISNRRVGGSENTDTHAAATTLVENLIPVYNSTKDDDKVDGFYHNKYWIIDGKHTFVYSGNWSPRSVTPYEEEYASGEANRDMGIAVHDATDIASFFKTEVWDEDVAVATAWELPVGIQQTSFSHADVVSGTVTLSAVGSGLASPTVSYRFGDGAYTDVTSADGSFSLSFDTTGLENGVTTFEVKAETGVQNFTDEVDFTVVNVHASNNWRVLITEFIPNPSEVADSEGEFIEITNSFPFAVLLGDWQIGTSGTLLTFEDDYEIAAYTSIAIARDQVGFQAAYGVASDLQLAMSLVNTGGYIQLRDASDEVIDVVAYGDATAPDGSEVLSAPGAGESVLRSPLHIDTDAAADFIFGTPDPKGTVPNEPLSTGAATSSTSTDTSSDEEEVPFAICFVLLVFPAIVALRRVRN